MRKYILLTLLTFYLLCIDCSAFTKYVTNNLNLRYEPTIHSYILSVIPRGSTTPAGATALCRDGTYSFSQSRRGTCSLHGGVARWY